MSETLRPLVWLNIVGLTPKLLHHAPNLRALAEKGSSRPIAGVVPAVTCPAQATALTGLSPAEHGIVGNGWYRRELGEVRFWVQANTQIGGETVYAAARRIAAERDLPFTSAKLFWWFNQGAPVDYSLTPKPWYGSDGSKVFGIQSHPADLAGELERELGTFPFFSFWGPNAGLPSSQWIAEAAATVLRQKRPTFTLVYLPHLDYDLQRFGPQAAETHARVAEVDRAAETVIRAANELGAQVVAFSEYGIVPVNRAILPNRLLREAGLLRVRDGPFGEGLDTFNSGAFAVCDHQVAHIYATNDDARREAKELLAATPGVARVLEGDERSDVDLDHAHAGDLVAICEPDAWFAYPYWLDDTRAPDFARTVDIHRKPGYDPLELFVDPKLRAPKLQMARRLLQKTLGFRYRMDVIPLDTSLIKGSHGVPPADPNDGPILISDDPQAAKQITTLANLKAHALQCMGLTAE